MVGAEASVIIVGGGPSALAAAHALRAMRARTLILDVGVQLEADRAAARQRLAALPPQRWDHDDLDTLRYRPTTGTGLAQKGSFGSNFAYRNPGVLDIVTDDRVGLRPSFATGGFSNVWGASMLPYTPADLAGWPLTADELLPHYRAVLTFVPYAAVDDGLSRRYPLLVDASHALEPSDVAGRLLDRLAKREARLRGRGYALGRSRLAVRVGQPAPQAGCTYCRRCLDGCPYGHIYNAADGLRQLAASSVEHRAGWRVDEVGEDDGAAFVRATELATGHGHTLSASRVVLAAGVVPTTTILQRSRLHPQVATIADSQTVFLPMAWFGGTGGVASEPAHTLAQVFVALDRGDVASHTIQAQLYTYNDSLADRARALRPELARLAGVALDRLTRRLVIAICYLHSSDSHRIAIVTDPEHVRLRVVDNPDTAATIQRFLRAFARDLAPSGLLALPPLAEVAKPGEGFHVGASIPMRASPRLGESDRLGRPLGTRRIHVVDASCLPSVPAGAVTFSIMANAHRIATEMGRANP